GRLRARSAQPRLRPCGPRLERSGDRDALRARTAALWQRQLEHAVLQLRLHLLGIDLVAQREAAARPADIGLLEQHPAAVGLLALRLGLGADGDHVAVHRHVDVLALHAGHRRGDLVGLVGFGHVDADVAAAALVPRARAEEAPHHLREEIVAIEASQSVHRYLLAATVFT